MALAANVVSCGAVRTSACQHDSRGKRMACADWRTASGNRQAASRLLSMRPCPAAARSSTFPVRRSPLHRRMPTVLAAQSGGPGRPGSEGEKESVSSKVIEFTGEDAVTSTSSAGGANGVPSSGSDSEASKESSSSASSTSGPGAGLGDGQLPGGGGSPDPGFWMGVVEETKLIQWPAFGDVVSTTGIVLAVIVFSSIAILIINAILAELSDRLFSLPAVVELWNL